MLFQIGSLNEFYLFEHQHVHKRSLFLDEKYHSRLKSDPQVIFIIKFKRLIYIDVLTYILYTGRIT